MKYLVLLIFLVSCKQLLVLEKEAGEHTWEPFCVLTGATCEQSEVKILWKDRYPMLKIANEITNIGDYDCEEDEIIWLKFCRAYKFPEGKVIGETAQSRIHIGEQYITTPLDSFLELIVYFIKEGVIEVKSSINRTANEEGR